MLIMAGSLAGNSQKGQRTDPPEWPLEETQSSLCTAFPLWLCVLEQGFHPLWSYKKWLNSVSLRSFLTLKYSSFNSVKIGLCRTQLILFLINRWKEFIANNTWFIFLHLGFWLSFESHFPKCKMKEFKTRSSQKNSWLRNCLGSSLISRVTF